MSIKGNLQELFVGKQSSNILDFKGKKETITYSELSSIDYSYFRLLLGGGYLNFTKKNGKVVRFNFNHSANDLISRTISLIQENNPDLEIKEHNVEDLKFYQRDWFIVMMLFLCLPIGVFFLWYYKKRDKFTSILLTIAFTFIWGLVVFTFWPRTYDHNITLNEYNQCVTGMTYQECAKIIGSEGEPLAEANILDINTSSYVWRGDTYTGANATMIFMNNELFSKAQIGLK